MKQNVSVALVFVFLTQASSRLAAEAPSSSVTTAVAGIDAVVDAGPYQPNWESLESYQVPQWYQDAKFGVFIHWGVYSVPAYGSEWYPKMMYVDRDRRGENMFQHHLETYGSHDKFGYKDFIPMFQANDFDPTAWAKLFKEAGCRYVVPVAEHHDGFPMYDCSFTDWDASQMGPKRDIIGELSTAVRGEGMKFGVSSHRAFNWMYYFRDKNFDNADPKYAGLYGRVVPHLFDKRSIDYETFFPPQDDRFKDDWLARSCELVAKYNPDLIWFDFGIAPSRTTSFDKNHYASHLQRFAAYYYNASSAKDGDIGVINYKWNAFPETAAVLDKERSKMAEIREPFWQTDTAVSKSSWGYTADPQYKSPDRLVDDLVDIVSKNGCLLLNIGPKADGTIPAGDQEILRAIGGWLKVNGEAIYGTRYWKVFGEGPTGVSTGHVSESKDQRFTSKDIRFTTNNGFVYAILLDWPQEDVAHIESLAEGSEHWPGKITSIELLGSDQQISWWRTARSLRVNLPKKRPCEFAFVLKLKGVDDSADETVSHEFKQKVLRANRVVFLGDSNTAAGEFISQIEATLLSNYDSVPELINLGLPSETCCGLSEPVHPFPRPSVQERLARALDKTKPDLVVACYGMNDGIYHPFAEERFEAFQGGIQQLIDAHAARSIPLILLTPPPFDPQPMRRSGTLVAVDAKEFSWSRVYEHYDSEVIEKYAQWMMTLDAPNCRVVDVHRPVNDYLAARRRSNPDFSFSTDGVHLDSTGHRVFADVILKSLGFGEELSHNQALWKLVRQRHSISHPAWLTEVGHLRPGVKAGLPLAEAKQRMEPISRAIESMTH